MVRLLALTLCLLVSCRTVQHPQQQPRLDAPPVPPKVGLSVERGVLTLDVRFTALRDTTSPQHHFVFGIDSMTALLQVRGQARFDTTLYLALINGTSGFQEKIDSIGTEGIAHWTNPLGLPVDTLHCVIRISTLARKQYVVQLDTVLALPVDSMPPFVTVTPFIDAHTDSSITFALLARRNRGAGGDYHPTSEHFRIEIYDERGALRFASNTGMDFLQVLSPVEPRRRGELKRYTFEWPGYDNEGNILPPGRYTAVLSIVAKPYPYTARIPFEWKGKTR
ncbi:MAG: hypothetical protein KatS3mg040_1515 [Candidatus Kapaibacterium sp.]|nr:MAG: hypothetical protein KatS3mg040_1515 [Candidatus Kapabacteria bacterium]